MNIHLILSIKLFTDWKSIIDNWHNMHFLTIHLNDVTDKNAFLLQSRNEAN